MLLDPPPPEAGLRATRQCQQDKQHVDEVFLARFPSSGLFSASNSRSLCFHENIFMVGCSRNYFPVQNVSLSTALTCCIRPITHNVNTHTHAHEHTQANTFRNTPSRTQAKVGVCVWERENKLHHEYLWWYPKYFCLIPFCSNSLCKVPDLIHFTLLNHRFKLSSHESYIYTYKFV